MKCPNCNATLVSKERIGIEIDYCPSCRGVWLDKDELDKIIERSAEYQQSVSGPPRTNQQEPYKSSNLGRTHQKHKKEKGFLGDFFDLDYP